MTHTPAPWIVGPHQRIISSGWSIRIADGSAIAYVLGEKNPELQQNARLIAAAPELLQEVIGAAKFFRDSGFANSAERLEALIAKATGSAA